jgi:hypothetical protein
MLRRRWVLRCWCMLLRGWMMSSSWRLCWMIAGADVLRVGLLPVVSDLIGLAVRVGRSDGGMVLRS